MYMEGSENIHGRVASPESVSIRHKIILPPSFAAMFTKRDSFLDTLFAYLQDEVFPK